MHRSAAALLVVLCAAPALSDERPAPEVRVWEGYLYKREGALELGWPVVAKGVAAVRPHVVVHPAGKALAPLVTSLKSSYVFWNYTLEEPVESAGEKLPHVLVRVRGPVSAVPDEGGSLRDAPLRMDPARLLSVEFVEPAWLEAWGTLFRERGSPWRIRDEPRDDPAATAKRVAPKVLAALRRMRAVPGPTAAQRTLVREIDPHADVTTRFRERTEHGIVHWLRSVEAEHGLGLALDDLGAVPPSGTDLQRWFLASATKAAFLERVRAAYDGDLGPLLLPHYVKNGNSTSWAETAVDDVAAWDDATYARARSLTQEIAGN